MNLPKSVKRLRAVLFLLGGFWVVLGLWRMVGIGDVPEQRFAGTLLIVILMLGNGGALLFLAYMLFSQRLLWFYGAFFVLATNLILSFPDQIGVIDLVYAGACAVAMAFLVQSWGWYREGGKKI